MLDSTTHYERDNTNEWRAYIERSVYPARLPSVWTYVRTLLALRRCAWTRLYVVDGHGIASETLREVWAWFVVYVDHVRYHIRRIEVCAGRKVEGICTYIPSLGRCPPLNYLQLRGPTLLVSDVRSKNKTTSHRNETKRNRR